MMAITDSLYYVYISHPSINKYRQINYFLFPKVLVYDIKLQYNLVYYVPGDNTYLWRQYDETSYLR